MDKASIVQVVKGLEQLHHPLADHRLREEQLPPFSLHELLLHVAIIRVLHQNRHLRASTMERVELDHVRMRDRREYLGLSSNLVSLGGRMNRDLFAHQLQVASARGKPVE